MWDLIQVCIKNGLNLNIQCKTCVRGVIKIINMNVMKFHPTPSRCHEEDSQWWGQVIPAAAIIANNHEDYSDMGPATAAGPPRTMLQSGAQDRHRQEGPRGILLWL